MIPRLVARVQVSALIRTAQARGGSAVVVRRGDPDGGAILLWLVERGRYAGLRERRLAPDGDYVWGPLGPGRDESASAVDRYVARRCAADPDLWVVELDVADSERLVVDIAASG